MALKTAQRTELLDAMDALDPERAAALIAWIKTGATTLHLSRLQTNMAARFGESPVDGAYLTEESAKRAALNGLYGQPYHYVVPVDLEP